MATERVRLNNEDSVIKKTNTQVGMTTEEKERAALVKQQIRANVANVYDLQSLRIAAGNRIVQAFLISMGKASSEKIEDIEDDKSQTMIKSIGKEYSRITDGIIELYKGNEIVSGFGKADIKKSIKNIQSSADKKDLLKYIVDFDSFKLYESYEFMHKAEESAVATLDGYVKQHPLWDAFFKDIKGCGTLMSAICIAYLDPHKANHVSSFFKYCGLDVVQDENDEGDKLFIAQDGTYRKVHFAYQYMDSTGGVHEGKAKPTGSFNTDGEPLFEVDGAMCTKQYIFNGNEQVYVDADGAEYTGEVVASVHGRRKGDTEMFEYVDKNGETKLKRGITYNPKVKTKLMGVLTGCLLKAKDPTYSRRYYEHRQRLDNSSYHKEMSDGRKNMMAQRYMIKSFLRDLWTTWRKLEGLTVDLPYEVEYLHKTPHRDNEYQCRVAGYKGEVAQ